MRGPAEFAKDRKKATHERVAFRILTADQHPDHETIADFRKRQLDALGGSFVQILRLCQEVGLVKLGHVSLDGTKVKANASKRKAMSYGRMEEKAEELEAEVKRLLTEAQALDDAEDAKYGKGKRGDELPKELRFKQDRLRKIKEAKKSLEQEAVMTVERIACAISSALIFSRTAATNRERLPGTGRNCYVLDKSVSCTRFTHICHPSRIHATIILNGSDDYFK